MSIVKYTLIRVLLFAGFAGVFYLLGMRSYLLVFTAILCGAMAGFIFFPHQRDQAAGSVENLVTKNSGNRPAKPKSGPSDEDIEDAIVTDAESGTADAHVTDNDAAHVAEPGTEPKPAGEADDSLTDFDSPSSNETEQK
ncbi:DUF4229 domain-containing protein [Flaviflexus massiliensis]|uniref:DUF4229 domain-containing protein n=1 Tax=Flaviflexus massiliensis TaxID=1522309 RepID=UPI0006D57CDD|nr:DUF4229 domain-containing protein [Flaviflexus massiliensis]